MHVPQQCSLTAHLSDCVGQDWRQEGQARVKLTHPMLSCIQGDDGVLMVDLPKHKGTLDHLLMTDKYHLVRGNMGSVTLLERE